MKITHRFRFEAAHRLPHVPDGHPCRTMHGHSYRVELRLEGPVDPDSGFVTDFFVVDAAFRPLLRQLDHNCLNEVAGLENPTTEAIAIWIWDRARPLLPLLRGVKVASTADCWVEHEG